MALKATHPVLLGDDGAMSCGRKLVQELVELSSLEYAACDRQPASEQSNSDVRKCPKETKVSAAPGSDLLGPVHPPSSVQGLS